MASFASVINLPNFHSILVRLDRSNYAFWRVQILSTTRAHGFDDLLDKFCNPPSQFLPSPSNDRIPNPDFLSWLRRDQYLVSWILSSISETMLGYVTRCATAREIWCVLEDLFQSQSKARVMQLKLQLQTQKKGDMSVDDFFLKMRGFADQLAAAGKMISDEDLGLHILAGFGVDYEAVVVNLTHRPDTLNLQEIQFALQAHEIRLQNQSSYSLPSAFVAHNSSPGGYHSGGRGGFQFNRGRGGRSFHRDNRMICQLCGRTGHVALKCFKRFDVHFTGTTVNSPQAYMTDVYSADYPHADSSYDFDADAQWYVDSGATHHITHDLANIAQSSTYAGTDQVAVGNGQSQSSGIAEGDTGKGVIPAKSELSSV